MVLVWGFIFVGLFWWGFLLLFFGFGFQWYSSLITASHKEKILPCAKSWLTSHKLRPQRAPVWGCRNSSGIQGRPPAESYPRKMLQSLQSLLEERSPAGDLFSLFRYWPCLGVGVGETHKREPEKKQAWIHLQITRKSYFLHPGVDANSGLSYFKFNSTWKLCFSSHGSWRR